ncbi:MAG: UbiD family decarboxylase [Pseudoxanthomonas sp.]
MADSKSPPATGTGALSLRDWLDRLSSRGEIAIARDGLKLKHEIAAVAKKLDGKRATFFPRPDGVHEIPVISGIVSDRGWMAEALGVEQDQLLAHFQHAALHPIPFKEVTDAPAQDIVHTDVDLLKQLPIPTHNEHDSGAYITAGLLISRSPETGIQNVAIHRCQISSKNRIGVLLLPRHTDHYYRMAEKAGKPLQMAIAIGVDPATLLSSQAIVPVDHDELEIAGALHGKPLEVVKCTSNEVRVPADAEIVIEGRLLADEREEEGPFGEFPQYYGERARRHVIEVDAITHRRGAMFHTIVGGGLEHLLLGAIPREATILNELQRGFPGVKDVHLALGGVGRYHLYVKLDKRQNGEGKNVILGAFAAHYDIKHVVVVDTDVDIHDPQEVEWAVSTRFQADRDLVVIAHSQGSKLDPSTEDGVGAKMGLDATIPVDAPEMKYKRIRIPGEERLDLDALLTTTRDWRAAGQRAA